MIGEYSTGELCRILSLGQARLRACLRAALLPLSRPNASCTYTFQDLVMLRTTKGLTEAGVPVAKIRKAFEGLQRQLGAGQALTSLKIYASGKRVVVRDGASHWLPDSGQVLLNFDAGRTLTGAGSKARPRSQPRPAETAHAWFERAMTLQEKAPEETHRACEETVRLRPDFVEAHINLGRLHRDAGDLAKAEACYRQALRHEPRLARAHFYLAAVLEAQLKRRRAIAAYEKALECAPKCWEAHCRLARLYETLGRQRDAIRHYAAARRLNP